MFSNYIGHGDMLKISQNVPTIYENMFPKFFNTNFGVNSSYIDENDLKM